MPILKNNKHELFAQALAKGNSQIEAYGLAGYKPDKGAASRLSTNVNVQARVGAERAGGKARLAGIDAKALETAVAECSKSAVEGRDPAFGKGSRAYNRYRGDALHGPNPCIAPVERGPFYAIKLVIGDLGAYGGIRTHEHARALDADGRVIAGLHAAGNDMASIMGSNYPGAGITFGPALIFGYIAGKDLAAGTSQATYDETFVQELPARQMPSNRPTTARRCDGRTASVRFLE